MTERHAENEMSTGPDDTCCFLKCLDAAHGIQLIAITCQPNMFNHTHAGEQLH